MANFKFGAKMRLFGEHPIEITPSPKSPFLIEYHDDAGIPITRELISDKLNIKDEAIQKMIPDETRITDVVVNTKKREFELGIVIEPGEDFALNKYKDIVYIEEVALYYKYNPQDGHHLAVNVDGHLDKEKAKNAIAQTAVDVLLDSKNDVDEEVNDAVEEMN